MKAALRILLVGAKGRMGHAITAAAKKETGIVISASCDQGDDLESMLNGCDVVIDFSQPDAIKEICRGCLEHKKPIVIGTTGHSVDQIAIIKGTATSLPVVFASNFSVGVNVLFVLARQMAQMLGNEFDLQIVETHHRTKKDAPSGTAKTLAGILQDARKLEMPVPIRSIREGDVVGEHSVLFSGPGERLELIHHAESRETFAKGAVRAAEWVVDKPAGLYSMEDVIGFAASQ